MIGSKEMRSMKMTTRHSAEKNSLFGQIPFEIENHMWKDCEWMVSSKIRNIENLAVKNCSSSMFLGFGINF